MSTRRFVGFAGLAMMLWAIGALAESEITRGVGIGVLLAVSLGQLLPEESDA